MWWMESKQSKFRIHNLKEYSKKLWNCKNHDSLRIHGTLRNSIVANSTKINQTKKKTIPNYTNQTEQDQKSPKKKKFQASI